MARSHVTQCEHGVAMNMPCRACSGPDYTMMKIKSLAVRESAASARPNPGNPAGWRRT